MARLLQFPTTRSVTGAQAEHESSRKALVEQYLWLQEEWDRRFLDVTDGGPSQAEAKWFADQMEACQSLLTETDIKWS